MIYNNGLSMENMRLYDRLSPGIRIKDNTATIQVGANSPVTCSGFERIQGEDLTYDKKQYNVKYTFNNVAINDVAVIKYTTVISDPSSYNASEYMPPNSIFDNKAFIEYDTLDKSGTGNNTVVSPLVQRMLLMIPVYLEKQAWQILLVARLNGP